MAAAREIGYPVVLKASASDLSHKTEYGLVRLDLRSDEEVRQSFRALTEIAMPGLNR